MHKFSLIAIVLAFMLPGVVQGQGCMEATSEEGVSVVGFFQPQFEYNEATDEAGFTFNRARVGLIGNIPYDVSYYLFLEFSAFKTNAPYLLDGFITYSRLAPYASFSMGQFKSPFSLELNTSCAGLHTINRSLVVNQLASPGRDIGLMLFGDYKKMISYSFALMNGTGIGNKDDNKGKDIVGRIVMSPMDFLNVGGSFRFGKSPPEAVDVEDEDERTRYGGELEIKYKDFLVQGEYIYGEDVGAYTVGGGGCGGDAGELVQGTVERSGLFIQGMYMTSWNLQPVIKYESWDPDLDTEKDLEQITTFGVNYFLNDWTRLQINYLYCAEEDGKEVDNDQILIQVQAKF